MATLPIDSRVSSHTHDFIAQKHRMFIDGRFVFAASGKTFPVYNPATGEIMAHVPEAEAEDVDRAVRAARNAFDNGPWTRMKPSERGRLIWKLGEFVEVLLEQVAELPDEAAAFGGLHTGPRAIVKGVSSSADGAVDVFSLGLGDVGHDFAGGGVVDGEGFSGCGEDEASVDEHAVFLGDEVVGVAADVGIDGKSCHLYLRRTRWQPQPGSADHTELAR